MKLVEPVFNRPLILGLLNSPLQQLALGINFNQKERMLGGEHPSIVGFIINHLQRVAETDLETNWIAWHAAAGHYNHDHKDAVPPYLRKQSHLSSKEAKTDFRFHHRSIIDVIEQGKPNTWTHYSLCDAMDWMPRASQVRLLEEIRRTAQPGARVLLRSVEDRDLIAECGQSAFLKRLDAESEQARREDRSCQYRRVDFYEVHA